MGKLGGKAPGALPSQADAGVLPVAQAVDDVGVFIGDVQPAGISAAAVYDSDFPVMKNAVKSLKDMGIPVEAHVLSAHRTPAEAGAFASSARQNGFGVIIAAAGKAAHLAGVLAGHTTLPVIGVPMKASVLDGMDALLATVQMPKGVPVATVAIDGADNAALLAAQILAVSEPALADKLEAQKQEMARQVLEKDKKLQAEAAAL